MRSGNALLRVLPFFPLALALLPFVYAHALELTPEEQDYLSKKGTVVFVSQTRYPPFEFVDENGQHEGMMLDVVRRLAVEIGFQPVFTDTTFQEAQKAVLAGRADVLTSLFYSDKRAEKFAFTSTLFDVPASIFVHGDRTDIKDIKDLNGKKIAMQKGDYAKEFLESKEVKFQVIDSKDFAEATDLVIEGKADAVIGDEQVVLFHVFSNNLSKLIKKVGEPLYTGRDCMAAAKSNAILIGILNKGIEEARSAGVLEKVNKKWLGTRFPPAEQSPLSTHLWPVVIAAVAILVLLLWVWLWNLSLRTNVRKKTEDIRRSEEALRKSEQILSGILAASPVAISMGVGRRITWVNDAWVEMFGLKDKMEHVGRSTRVLYASQEEYERVGKALYQELETNRVNETDVKFLRIDGSPFDAQMRLTSFDESDLSKGVIVACSDISDRKRAESATRDSEQRLAQIINFLPDATFVIDMAGKVVAWNRAIEEMTGVKANDIVGKGDYEYSLAFYPERRPVLIDLVYKRDKEIEKQYAFVKEEGDVLVSETRPEALKFDGVHLWNAARPLYDTQGNVVGAIESIRDITALRHAQELVLQTERYKAVSDLAAGVAHNFNNLLQIVMGGVQLARMTIEKGNTDGALKSLDQILESSRFGAETVKRLQNFAGISPVDQAKGDAVFDLSEVVMQAIDMTKTWWKTSPEKDGFQVRLATDLRPGCLVKGKKSEMFEVAVNLIKNAAEALPDGGEIRIDIMVAEDHVLFHVGDNGVGINSNDINRIFNPFFTTKTHGGSGLGLAASRQTINRHGGHILVDSEEGKGTVFKVRLPLVEQSHGGHLIDSDDPIERKLRILVIDDMESLGTVLSDGLTAFGQTVVTALTGREGLELFKTGSVDLVICDLGMPGMNGWQVGKGIKDICGERAVPKTPFILLTGWGGQIDELDRISEADVQAIVEKPVDMPKLMTVIDDVLRESA
jgi:PAS domain S-box-containing protein